MGRDNDNKPIWDSKLGKHIVAIGTILSFLIGAFGLVMYFKKDAPKLEFIIESESCLINNDEQLPQVRIMVDSVDILNNDENITIYSVKITNKGSKNISFYDYDNEEIGIRVHNGRIIDVPSLLDASSEYLANKFKTEFSAPADTLILLPHSILNIDDYYVLHICILHHRDISPTFESFGQIVGQKRIDVVNFNREPSNWQLALKGSFFVQLYRLFVYGLSLIVLIFIIAALYHWISLLVKYMVQQWFLFNLKQRNSSNQIVVSDYRKNGYKNIGRAYMIREVNTERLTALYKEANECLNSPDIENKENRHWKICKERIRVYDAFARIGYLIIFDDSRVKFNPLLKEAVAAVHDMILKDRAVRENMGLGYDMWSEEVMLGERSEGDSHDSNNDEVE